MSRRIRIDFAAAIGGGKLHVGHRIAHEEADAVIKGRVELRNACHEQGGGSGRVTFLEA